MTSTDSIQTNALRNLRLPPVPGFLKDLLSEGIRARQRRLWMQQRQDTDLVALTVPDTTISRCVQAAAIQASEAMRWLRQECAGEINADRRAAIVFLRAALCIQAKGGNWLDEVLELTKVEPAAVHDALASFPAPIHVWGESTEHVKELWTASLEGRSELPWLCGLVTSTGCRELLPELQLRLSQGVSSPEELVALAALGDQSRPLKERILKSLAESSTVPTWAWAALEVAPCLVEPSALRSLLPDPGSWPHQAWPWLALRDPAWVLSNPDARNLIPDNLRLRLFALMGHLAALFSVCADLSLHDRVASAEQRDVLILMAGEVPSEVAVNGGDHVARDKALRALFLRVCRQAHIGVSNDADQCPWELDQVLAEPSASQPAVRLGRRMQSIPSLDTRLAELSQCMRQWVYMERAAKAEHAFPLSALSISRRQWQAIDVADFVDELRNR